MPVTFSILIVDDEPQVRSLLNEVLRPQFQCTSVENAREALRLVESQLFHAALVDLGLPGMSGLALCRLIVRLSPKTSVIVVSGDADDQSVADAMQAGAVDYIRKPFDLGHVISTVQRLLNHHQPGAVA